MELRRVSRWWAYFPLALVGVVLAALAPWVRASIRGPDEPFDVSIIYRNQSGDIQYFPFIAQLARGSLTDGTIKEAEGSVLRSFPNAIFLPHAVSIAAFGNYGFVVGDAIVAAGYFLLLILFFRTLGVSRLAATAAALFIALPIPIKLSFSAAIGPFEESFRVLTALWGTRIPRPFISEVYVLLMLVVALRVLASDRPGRLIHWLALAGAFGLLIQSDLHSAMVFALFSPVLLFEMVRRLPPWVALRNAFLASLFLAAIASPFFVARLFEDPDIPVRWGVFEGDRLDGFDRSWAKTSVPVALTVAVIYFVAMRASRRPNLIALDWEDLVGDPEPVRRVWRYAVALVLAAFASKPASILLLGKTIHPYHFDDRTYRLCSYLIIGFALVGIDYVVGRAVTGSRFVAAHRRLARWSIPAAMLLLIVGFVGYSTFVYRGSAGFRGHLRERDYPHLVKTRPPYRESFAELTSFLDGHVSDDAVIASFDHQVFVWWMTFHRGYWFLVEPFVSGIPDEELEIRLALLGKLLGMTSQEYVEFVQRQYIDQLLLGLAKYQASEWYTYSTLDDYTEEQRQIIRKPVDDADKADGVWQTFIPQSELRRLKKHFEDLSLDEFDDRELDVVVLSNSGPERSLAPPLDRWSLVFENDGFRVYSTAK